MHVYKVSVVLVDTCLQRLVITGIASLLAEHSRSLYINPGLPTSFPLRDQPLSLETTAEETLKSQSLRLKLNIKQFLERVFGTNFWRQKL